MSRPTKHDPELMLDAALRLLRERGVRGVTMTAVAEATGAPSGSLYHRFASRDALLGELWLRTVERFQAEFVARLQAPDAWAATEGTLRHVFAWLREHPDEAQLLLMYRRRDISAHEWPEELVQRVRRLADDFDRAMQSFAGRLGGAHDEAVTLAWFLLVDLPLAAARRHLAAGRPIPPAAERLTLEAARALLDTTGAPPEG